MNVKNTAAITMMLFLQLSVFSSTDTVLDRVYSSKSAPLKESLWLLLNGAELLSEESSVSDVDEWISFFSRPEYFQGEALTYGQLALAVEECYPVPRGLFSILTGSPRYALRDLAYLGLVSSSQSLNSELSPFELINILGVLLEGMD